jgi:hypothetical protein
MDDEDLVRGSRCVVRWVLRVARAGAECVFRSCRGFHSKAGRRFAGCRATWGEWREIAASNKELAKRFDELEARLTQKLATHDQAIAGLLNTIRQLMNPPGPKRRGIGFTADLSEQK